MSKQHPSTEVIHRFRSADEAERRAVFTRHVARWTGAVRRAPLLTVAQEEGKTRR